MTVASTTRTPAANLTASQTVAFRARKDQSYEFVKYVGVDTALSTGNPEKSAIAASQQAADQGWPALSSAKRRLLEHPCGAATSSCPTGLTCSDGSAPGSTGCCRTSGRARTTASARSG